MNPGSSNPAGKVLIIDDEEPFLQVMAKFLRKQGFEVVAAPEGQRGLALAAETQPDLVVCDLNMPGLDGYGVLAALRQDPKLADIPLIFLTGLAAPGQVRQGMNLGADDYLTKPVNLADLLSAVKVRLSRRQSQSRRQEKQLERAMQLFGGIVHDLRDPLFVVLGYTDLLRSSQGGTAGADQSPKQILDRMQQAVLRMQEIISETLFLARSRMQRLPFDPGPLELRAFCQQLVADHEQSRRLQFEAADGAYPLTADALRLRQALDNLLSNALKYSDAPVVLSLSASPQGYQLEVRDEGIGIPADEQGEVFEPFFRASNTGERPGHGLGLSVVKSCIEQHGGSVRFTSNASKGTTFTVELPGTPPAKQDRPSGAATPANRSAAPALVSATLPEAGTEVPPTPALVRSSRLRSIIVDDDPLVRHVLRDLLEASGEVQVVGEAGTVAQARLLVRQQSPQMVLLDVKLPDGSGFDLLPDLKPAVSVVFVSSADDDALHAFDCAAVDYLLKPVGPERLKQALARVRQRMAPHPAVAAAAASRLSDSFLVNTLTEKRLVKVNDIERIIAYGEYSWVYWHQNPKGALLRKSLKQWLSELPAEQFLRVHRRAIINLACMEHIEKLPNHRMQVHLRGTPEPILVSLRLAPILNSRLKALRG